MSLNSRRYGRQVPVLIILFIISCNGSKKEENPVVPPATSPLSRNYIGYGVINVSYTYLRENPHVESVSPGYLRRGSVILILERQAIRKGNQIERWVLVEGNEKGWLKEELVDIYDNELQARTAAESMTR